MFPFKIIICPSSIISMTNPEFETDSIEETALHAAALGEAVRRDSDPSAIRSNRLLERDAQRVERSAIPAEQVQALLCQAFRIPINAGQIDVRLWAEEDPPVLQIVSGDGEEEIFRLELPPGETLDAEIVCSIVELALKQRYRARLYEALSGQNVNIVPLGQQKPVTAE
jgi:hypothetical protein